MLTALALCAAASACRAPAEPGPAPAPTPSPPQLLPDLGTYHRAIATRSPEAQRWFDQGLRLTYAFNHDEAERSFRKAAELDPRCAMCFWGVALVLGPNINLPPLPERARAAYAASRQAAALAGEASPVERALISAVGWRYASEPPHDPAEQARLDQAYADAMRVATKQFSDDPDVAALAAEALMDLRPWDLWQPDGTPRRDTLEILAMLERALAKDPSHPGANHYYIHALEGSPHPERALAAAERVGGMMPGAGHLVHMPAHVFVRVGRYAQASDAGERAVAADRAYAARAKPAATYAIYVAHNHQFLAYSAMMEGRGALALDNARAMVAAAPMAMIDQMPGMDYALPLPLFALVRFERWDEVLAEPAPPPTQRYPAAIRHYARSLASAAEGRLAAATTEQQLLAAAVQQIPPDLPAGINSARALLDVATLSLAGELAAQRGDPGLAIRQLEAAVRAEDALRYDEPPDWPLPIRPRLGALLLAAGRPAEAEAVYRADLVHNPENGWALRGLAAVLRAEHKSADEIDQRLASAWRRADPGLRAAPR